MQFPSVRSEDIFRTVPCLRPSHLQDPKWSGYPNETYGQGSVTIVNFTGFHIP